MLKPLHTLVEFWELTGGLMVDIYACFALVNRSACYDDCDDCSYWNDDMDDLYVAYDFMIDDCDGWNDVVIA